MKNKILLKFILAFSRREKKLRERGFTLIELVMVFIIIGILSAIALPSLLNQSAKAKQSEAKFYVGSINRAQQAFRMENSYFASTLAELQIGISPTTSNYNYTIDISNPSLGGIIADPLDDSSVKGYSGGVLVDNTGLTRAASCQTIDVNDTTSVQLPTIVGNTLDCQGNMKSME